MNNFICEKVVLNEMNVRSVCLRSEGINEVLIDAGNSIASRLGDNAEVVLRKGYGKRSRVYVNMPLAETTKDNKLLKATNK